MSHNDEQATHDVMTVVGLGDLAPSIQGPYKQAHTGRTLSAMDKFKEFVSGSKRGKVPGQYKRPVAHTHPEYDAHFDDWEFYRTTYEGGREYRALHLFKHPKEPGTPYDRRVERAVNYKHTAVVIDTYEAHLFKLPATRTAIGDAASTEVLETFWADVTRRGQDAQEFFAECFTNALRSGACAVIIDRFDGGGETPQTLADERTVGVRPFAYRVAEQDLIDWDVSDDGEIQWVMVRERRKQTRKPTDPFVPEQEIFRCWRKDGWTLYEVEVEKKKGNKGEESTELKYKKLEEGSYDLGFVPIEFLYPVKQKGKQPIGHSFVVDIAPLQKRLMNHTSLIDEQIYQYVFSLLCVPDSTFAQLAEVNFSVAGTLPYNDEVRQKPFYLSPDIAQLSAIREEISKTESLIRFASGLGRQNEASQAAASGISLAYQTVDKKALINTFGQKLSDFEGRVNAMALRVMGIDPAEKFAPTDYKIELQPDELDQELSAAAKYASLMVGGSADVESAVIATRARLSRHLTSEQLDEVIKDVRENFRSAADLVRETPGLALGP